MLSSDTIHTRKIQLLGDLGKANALAAGIIHRVVATKEHVTKNVVKASRKFAALEARETGALTSVDHVLRVADREVDTVQSEGDVRQRANAAAVNNSKPLGSRLSTDSLVDLVHHIRRTC